MKEKKIIFHRESAVCHKSMKTVVMLNKLGFSLLPRPPYSPDLAPVTIGSLLISERCFREEDLTRMKKLSVQLKLILRSKILYHSTSMVLKSQKSIEMIKSHLIVIILMKKMNFVKQMFSQLVLGLIEQCVILKINLNCGTASLVIVMGILSMNIDTYRYF